MTTLSQESLSESELLTREALRSSLERLDADNRRVCGYHLGYWGADGTTAGSDSGKGVRPTLALLSAEAAGAPSSSGIPAAVACELVHNFSLLHDDIMDGDDVRRHRPTAWSIYGTPSALLAGDALLVLACEVLAEATSASSSHAVRCLTAATRRLIAGQALDLAFERRDNVTLEECLEMESGKTGALLACSASLGAVLAAAPPALTLGLAEFGEHLGRAFQLVDDLLGIWGSPERTGKPVLSDLRSRKKSAPVVAALCSGTPAGDRLHALYRRSEPLSEADLVEAAALVEDTGGRAFAEDTADHELAGALGALNRLDLPPRVDEQLRDLAEELARRDH